MKIKDAPLQIKEVNPIQMKTKNKEKKAKQLVTSNFQLLFVKLNQKNP